MLKRNLNITSLFIIFLELFYSIIKRHNDQGRIIRVHTGGCGFQNQFFSDNLRVLLSRASLFYESIAGELNALRRAEAIEQSVRGQQHEIVSGGVEGRDADLGLCQHEVSYACLTRGFVRDLELLALEVPESPRYG